MTSLHNFLQCRLRYSTLRDNCVDLTNLYFALSEKLTWTWYQVLGHRLKPRSGVRVLSYPHLPWKPGFALNNHTMKVWHNIYPMLKCSHCCIINMNCVHVLVVIKYFKVKQMSLFDNSGFFSILYSMKVS